MTHGEAQGLGVAAPAAGTLAKLAERAERLGAVALWRRVGEGAVAAAPEGLCGWVNGLAMPRPAGFRVLAAPEGWVAAEAADRFGTVVTLALPVEAGRSEGPLSVSWARGVLSVLGECFEELAAVSELEREYGVFAKHLDHSYEATTVLYQLARTLGDVRNAPRFVGEALSGLSDALLCKWAALVLHEASVAGDIVLEAVTLHTADESLTGMLRSGLHRALTEAAPRARRGIITDFDALGAEELIIEPVLLDGEPAGWLALGKCGGLAQGEDRASSYDTQAVEIVAGFAATVLESMRLYQEQERTYMGSLRALTGSLEAKDPYTRGHSERVALLARELAIATGMSGTDAERVHLCGTLHDIGKIGVPDRVLCKPSRLTDDEFELIKQHPRIGHNILRDIPALTDILPGVLHHHERWDGRGYPDGLAGEAIPPLARILAVADTFDAMSSNRAYRSSRPREEVLAEFRRCAGTQFAPDLVEPFVHMDFAAFDAMKAVHEAGDLGNQRAERAA